MESSMSSGTASAEITLKTFIRAFTLVESTVRTEMSAEYLLQMRTKTIKMLKGLGSISLPNFNIVPGKTPQMEIKRGAGDSTKNITIVPSNQDHLMLLKDGNPVLLASLDPDRETDIEMFERALKEASKRIYKDKEGSFYILVNKEDWPTLLKHEEGLHEIFVNKEVTGTLVRVGEKMYLMVHENLYTSQVQVPFLVSEVFAKDHIQVMKEGVGSILVASLQPFTTIPFSDTFTNMTPIEEEVRSLTSAREMVPTYTGRKGLPPRISYKGWNSLPLSEARELVLSGGFHLNEVEGATESSPHVEQVLRKFHTFRGDITSRFPEMTFSDTCYLLFALDDIIPYPNLQSGIQRAFVRSPDFFTNIRETLYENLKVVRTSFCGGYENEYLEDVAGTVVDMLKTWYMSLTTKATPTKESLYTPVANRSDEALLFEFQQAHPEQESIESELERRSRGKPFLVYLDEDCSKLDMENTLSFLKDCRKKEVASQGQYRDPQTNKLLRLFRISEVNWKSRVREICPVDPKSILFRGYCSACDVNFSKYSYPQRQAIAFALRSIETKGHDYAMIFKYNLIPYLREHPDGEGLYKWLQDNGFKYLHSDMHQATVAGTLPILTVLENPVSSDVITPDMHPHFRKGV